MDSISTRVTTAKRNTFINRCCIVFIFYNGQYYETVTQPRKKSNIRNHWNFLEIIQLYKTYPETGSYPQSETTRKPGITQNPTNYPKLPESPKIYQNYPKLSEISCKPEEFK